MTKLKNIIKHTNMLKESASLVVKVTVDKKTINYLLVISVKDDYITFDFIPKTTNDLDILKNFSTKDAINKIINILSDKIKKSTGIDKIDYIGNTDNKFIKFEIRTHRLEDLLSNKFINLNY